MPKLQLRIFIWGAGRMYIEKYVRDNTVHYSSKLQPLKHRVILYYFLFWFILFHRNNLFPIKFYHHPIPLLSDILFLSFFLIYFYSFRSFVYSDLFSPPFLSNLYSTLLYSTVLFCSLLFPSLLFSSLLSSSLLFYSLLFSTLLFSTVLVTLLLSLSLLSSILLLFNFLTLSSHL